MRASRLSTAGVAASLALVLAPPLLVAHLAGAATGLSRGARVSFLVVGREGAAAMLPDGTSRAAVPWLLRGDDDLAVSPSGRRLAFSSARTGDRELYVADLVTGALDRLTRSPRRNDVEPTWSPDGTQLVWASGTRSNYDLYRMRVDRRGAARRLTDGPHDDREPAWSPDGRRIAFASDALGAFDLWTVAAGGGTSELLVDAPGAARDPDWHPSGRRIAYTSLLGGRADVWVAALDGTVRPLVVSPAHDRRPDWSSDGRHVAFLRGRVIHHAWRARADGGAPAAVGTDGRGAAEVIWGALGGELAPTRSALPPDLDQRAPSDLVVRDEGGGAFVLGFTSATDNIGLGPVWLRARRSAPGERMPVEQLVADENGSVSTLRGVGELRYELHPPHRHWHLDDFVRYELRTLDGETVVRDRKSGFCLVDRWGHSLQPGRRPTPPPRFTGDCGARLPDALEIEQGTSVGFTDRYPAFFHGQDLPLSGVPAGRYVLVQVANPERRLREQDYGNNAASALLRLTWPAGLRSSPRVEVLRRCGDSASCPLPRG